MNASSDPGVPLQNCATLWGHVQLQQHIHSVWTCAVRLYDQSFFLDLCVSDPFAAVFGSESFGGGFADFSALAKVSHCSCSCSMLLPSHVK